VQRLTAGCGAVLVSSGIPLAPGALTEQRVSQLRLFVGGTEQQLFVEPMRSTHPDGSLRAVLVQFTYPLTFGTPVAAQLIIGQSRGKADVPRPSAPRTTPAAIVLPTDPDYLVSTQLVGPTITVRSGSQLSDPFQKYEADFEKHANNHWNQTGATWTENYYDRALIYYAWWVRSANVEYWKRATAVALSYRTGYLEPKNYRIPAHWAQIEGLELHYLLTGDEKSRYAVGRIGDEFNTPYYMENLGKLDGVMENRIQARTLVALLTAWKLNAPSQKASAWATVLPQALDDILSSQDDRGAYRFIRQDNQCGHNKPFMVGLLNDALIKYYTEFRADPRIPVAVRKSVDYMWANDWDDTAQSFVYLDGPCAGNDVAPAPDLNNLIVNGFGWVYRRTGDRVYLDRAERIFAGAVAKAWLEGSKQFNQQYASSFRYLAYRE
jgi:hypothetical protein